MPIYFLILVFPSSIFGIAILVAVLLKHRRDRYFIENNLKSGKTVVKYISKVWNTEIVYNDEKET